MAAHGVRSLFYITHRDNVESILAHGILCHRLVENALAVQAGSDDGPSLARKAIYDESIVQRRRQRLTPSGEDLWAYANLYFQPRNPMLFRVVKERGKSEIAVISVSSDVLYLPGTYVSLGNAASAQSELVSSQEALKQLPRILKDTVERQWWSDVDSSKRRIMAECLVHDRVPPEHIQTIYVADHETQQQLASRLPTCPVPTVVQPDMFFEPLRTWSLTPTLAVVEGDMFFSKLQTLTISVNCKGIMGKGLASRAKYQFPDVYVLYQDLCRSRELRMGRPCLHKREASFDYQLADDPASIGPAAQSQKWFLLFATKRDWREPSDIRGIEEGLDWLSKSYQHEGIESLAIPALGCGLGRLLWRDVGPLLCRYLRPLTIPVEIYLPAEKAIPDEQLSKDFLLGDRS